MGSAVWPGPQPDGSLQGRLIARSASFMAADFAWRFDEFANASPGNTWNIAGSPTVDGTRGPGVLSFPNTNLTLLANTVAIVANASITKWHIAGRFRLLTAVAGGEIKGISLNDGGNTNFAHVGLRQGTSAVKWVFAVMKASATVTALSTINLDITNYHVEELWFDGTNVFGSVDNETPVLVTGVANTPIVPLLERHGTEVAAGAAAGFLLDSVYFAAERTAT